MTRYTAAAIALSLLASASCSGRTGMDVTGHPSALMLAPSLVPARQVVPAAFVMPAVANVASPAALTPIALTPGAPLPGSVSSNGTVGPLTGEDVACFADRYPCATYDFSLDQEGPIEVTLTWDGAPRALMVQLYWAGEGLAHEDVAPRSGPSRIWFRRPRMEAAAYSLRVVSLEPDVTIPFTLTLTH